MLKRFVRSARFSLSLMVVTVLAGGAAFATSSAPKPSALRFRLTAEPATLDWNLARSSHETHLIMNLMEGLLEIGADLQPKAALAERWEASADGKTYTFYLRPGVKWSDGRALKAQDFVDSWLRLLSPKTRSPYSSFLFDVENAEAYHLGKVKDGAQVGVRALDDQRLQVKLARAVPYFLHVPTFWVTFPIRLDLIQKHGANWAKPGKIVTLGPYLLTGWKAGESLELKRNPTYYGTSLGQGPSIETVSALVETRDSQARLRFGAGELDFLLEATTQDLMRTQAAGKGPHAARVEQYPYLATYYLGFNVNRGPFKNPDVRKALGLALDRSKIPSTLQGGQVAARGWIPPGVAGHGGEAELKPNLHDARGALAKAGYFEGSGFPKATIWVEKFDGAEVFAEFLTRSFKDKLGIELRAKVAGPAEFQKTLKEGKADLFVNHWGADYPDPNNFFEVFTSTSGTNSTGWKNAQYDGHVARAKSSLDSGERLMAYTEAERILVRNEAVIVPLFYRKNAVLVGPRLQRFEISPLNYLFLKKLQLRPEGDKLE